MREHLPEEARPGFGPAIGRAIAGRCPNCGRGKLFASYLKAVERCTFCNEAYGHIRSDDAAPWLTILLVGHLLVPTILAVETRGLWPSWVSMAVWPLLAVILALALLPRSKALFVGVIWFTGATGSEKS